MRSGRLEIFITPGELRAPLDSVRIAAHLHLVLFYYPQPAAGRAEAVVAVAPGQPFCPDPFPDQLFLSAGPPPMPLAGTDLGALAYAHGWIYVLAWAGHSEALYLCTVSFRSPRPHAQPLFRRVKRRLLAHLLRGVVVSDAHAAAPEAEGGRLVKDIYYSAGAREAAARGIPWHQYDVANSRFWPVPST